MFLGELTNCTITSALTFRVTARNVMLEAKAIDSGMRVKLYVSNPAMIYYFIRYCDVGTRHHLTGPLYVTAYTFDDSTRAFSSICLSVDSARPLPTLDDDGNIIGTTATKIRIRDLEKNHKFLKLRYVFENIYNEDMVMGKGLNVEAFATQLNTSYEKLVSEGLIMSNYNPVTVVESVTRPTTDPNTNRPVPRVIKSTYLYNESIRRLEDWANPNLSLRNLLNDHMPFSVEIFVVPASSRTTDDEDEMEN
ncbi:uncharacterized protein EV154DRAFT_514094 [Mucor mucedo]|uniref:uncharacterized protein n=1 Tax=Mucor mucedo TaxID=29922 RepID=UPI002220976A|nr:uncharacterized protein EV154DRAFT_514094 [Mucor mucedo]KAI7889656.1 hypothetical protein EV154DRAFT_514094 [Mucor mucedo]